jgi:hypothetical protein
LEGFSLLLLLLFSSCQCGHILLIQLDAGDVLLLLPLEHLDLLILLLDAVPVLLTNEITPSLYFHRSKYG